eukprot:12969401-Alexandrium_andersonii.AAC.1
MLAEELRDPSQELRSKPWEVLKPGRETPSEARLAGVVRRIRRLRTSSPGVLRRRLRIARWILEVLKPG